MCSQSYLHVSCFSKNEHKILPVNWCSCQLIAWEFQYAPGSAEGTTYRRVRQSAALRLGPKGTTAKRRIRVRQSVGGI